MLPHPIFSDEHELSGDQVRRLLADEVVPRHAAWEADGIVPRPVWSKAGAVGLCGFAAQSAAVAILEGA
ncbi:MAG: acyl-CoA dehydrogenase family protein [Burkholderiaceae bacterium]|nr:acyl-CoA dehydrogenase family protein [Burkholderiaceae bacterium]